MIVIRAQHVSGTTAILLVGWDSEKPFWCIRMA